MKTLYDENFRYSDAADELSSRSSDALLFIFQSFVKQKFSPREIAHVINGVVHELELAAVLNHTDDAERDQQATVSEE